MGSRDTYNRYSDFITNGKQTVVPYVDLPTKSTDKRYIYKVGQSRLDKVSQEWNITDGSILTIPFPLVASLQDYKNQLDNHFFYYGR